ncbi:hypothetical protein BCR39DRAFT_183221 [Naematelia encephala]|uniref:GDP/GTP exchange factor Sec2 N-terminal domain-containing protein n=1 Tax=Naematelia encephala TaxID=71784 RepID=A0A1Y2B2G6_9TREE|nr:hypothetical protein BCR39DRAFT_183221 [Naematelia encephala]
MAEANTEMLEEQLKRGRSGTFSGHLGGAAGSPVTPSNPTRQTPQTSGAAVPRAVTNPTRAATATTSATTTPARKLDETKRPTSLQIPASASNSAQTQNVSSANGKDEGKGWKFWNKQQKLGGVTLPSPAQVMAQIPGTPTSERPFDFSTLMPSAQAAFGLPDAPANPNVRAREIPLQRSSSMQTINGAQRPPGTPSGAATQVSELARLRAAHAAAQTKIETMGKELVELKKGKVDMEAELENLSQALFEEANKMVADERRRRAEIEELLKEVREEREALRSTIKVLGGKVEEEAQAAGEEEETKVDEVKDSEDPDFVPRDLDKHYEALRKTIHHVSDGANTAGGIPDLSMVSNMPVLEEGPHEEDEVEELEDVVGELETPDVSRLAASEPNLLGIGVGNTSLGAELNPWADPFANAASTIIPPGQAALPGEEELRPTRNAFLDEVAPDVAGEGEPPSVVEAFGVKQDVAP